MLLHPCARRREVDSAQMTENTSRKIVQTDPDPAAMLESRPAVTHVVVAVIGDFETDPTLLWRNRPGGLVFFL